MFAKMRLRTAAILAGLALALSGCFLSPGKFSAELALTGPDSFTFRYDGEIVFLGLSKLAQMSAGAEESFTASCVDSETFESRPCTRAEEAEQRLEWDAGADERAAHRKREAAQIAALMGGIDPSDPDAAEELVSLLQRQKGWDRVAHKGDGVFDVSYQIAGSLGHDFLFPQIEGFPITNPFVQMILRKGDQVRINASGFAAQTGDNPMAAMMGGMGSLAGLAAMEQAGEGGDGAAAQGISSSLPQIDGLFTIRTVPGMRILANNTDEGASAVNGGEVLTWRITPRTVQAPTALIATSR